MIPTTQAGESMARGRDENTDSFATLETGDGFGDDEPTMPLMPHLMDPLKQLIRPPHLERVEGTAGPARVEIGHHPFVIGRSSTADIVLDSASLSRHHARIERRDHETVLTDLDSRNGIFLNGVRVHSAVLRDRDTIQIGAVVYLYRDGS